MLTSSATSARLPRQLFEQLGAAADRFLVTVSDRAALRTPFTTDLVQITNSLLFTQPNGSTALLDGVHLALSELKKSTPFAKSFWWWFPMAATITASIRCARWRRS